MRLAPFRADADGDEDLAVRLYEWNGKVSAAFMGVFHHVEVVLRNRLDESLTAAFPASPDPWYLSGSVLTEAGIMKARDAIARIEGEGKEPTHGRVVAALPWGFWDSLFGRRYEELWRHCLSTALRDRPSTRHDVARVTSRLRIFRNRLAHHERLLHLNLAVRHADLLMLSAWIGRAERRWIASQSEVPALLEARPS